MICHCNHVPICAECGGKVPVRKVAPRKVIPGESRKAKRERKRLTHREEMEVLRMAVFTRAGGRCEFVNWKGTPEAFRCERTPSELHHLEGGSGRRRQRQTVENCRAYCFDCHRAAHRASRRSAP